VPLGGTSHQGNLLVVGHVIDVAEVDHAVTWHSADGGQTWGSTPLSGPLPSVAKDIACDEGSDLCIAVGHVGEPPQPVAWENSQGSGWTLVTLPLLPGGTGGDCTSSNYQDDYDPETECVMAGGHTVGPSGFYHAVLWERDAQGVWSVSALPDFGEGRNSGGHRVTLCPDDPHGPFCTPGALLIAGWAQNEQATPVPVVWVATPMPPWTVEDGAAKAGRLRAL
jgi:hypothetical protein